MLCPRCKTSVSPDDNYCSRCGSVLRSDADRRVVVTGVGAVSPLGNTAEETWQGLRDGYSGIRRIERFDPSEITVQIAGEVRDFDMNGIVDRKTERGMALFTKFGVTAASMAMRDSCLQSTDLDPDRVGVVVGTGAGGMATILETEEVAKRRGLMRISPHFMTTFPHNLPAYHIHQLFGFYGPSLTVSTACATGAQAIGEAAQFIRSGQADIAIAGGTEHCIFPLFVASFAVQRAASTMNDEPEKASMPFDADRHGFVLGEGAAMVVLETLEHARKRGATIYAELLGYGASDDGYHPIAPEPEGRGSAYAMKVAMEEGGVTSDQVDYVNAHAASTPLGDKAETLAIKKTLGEHAYEVPVSSTKSMIGHLMGAAGAIEAMATILTIRDQVVHPTINYRTPDPECDLDYVPNTGRRTEVNIALSNSIGLGGQNTCLAFGRVAEQTANPAE